MEHLTIELQPALPTGTITFLFTNTAARISAPEASAAHYGQL
jgi:hypothetical protein